MSAPMKLTDGPWRWEFNAKHKSVHIVGGRPAFDLTVMDFARWEPGVYRLHMAPGVLGDRPLYGYWCGTAWHGAWDSVAGAFEARDMVWPGLAAHATAWSGISEPEAELRGML